MMSPDPSANNPAMPAKGVRVQERKATLWRNMGGGSLSISIIVHVILLAIGVIWIFQVIPEKKQDVSFMPKGGGGGSPGVKEISNQKQRATMSAPSAPRMVAKGAASTFTLPEPDAASTMASVGALTSGGLSGGLGGSGSGGGRGDGKGKGFGSGMGPGLGGAGAGMTPFGMINPSTNALVGVLYDAKQSPDHKPYDISPQGMGELLRDFTGRGWNERSLSGKYFQAERKLYLTHVYMPLMAAGEAPKAFQCEKEVQASRWLIVYRGNVIAPKTGKFRFVGTSDDTLVVRFNRQNVFDHGFYKGTTGLRRSGREEVVRYKYPNSPHYNDNIGGYEVGTEFDARAGSTYPIEILISEIPGGYFGAALMIQETGVEYPKTETGAPLLPLFRVDEGPAPQPGGNAPPFAPQGPVWKLAGGRDRPEI